MRALVISDVHANIVALEAIWRRERGCDALYCAGDLVDYGVFPREVLAWVREHRPVCVQGNHDAQVAATFRDPQLHAVPEAELHWRHHNARLLGEQDAAFLEGLPRAVSFVMDGVRYGMTHMYRGYDLILSRTALRAFLDATFPPDEHGPVRRLILGHTHRRAVMYLSDDELWLNPGSVSYRRPDDPDQHAHYLTITDGRIELHSVPYDTAAVAAEVERHRLAEPELRVARWFFGRREAPEDLLR